MKFKNLKLKTKTKTMDQINHFQTTTKYLYSLKSKFEGMHPTERAHGLCIPPNGGRLNIYFLNLW